MINQTKASDFLQFIADNDKQLRQAVKKNITYDEELFEDVFSDTVIKCYDKIIEGHEIEDFKNYFFIACKFNYINAQAKKRKMMKQSDRDILFNISHGLEKTNGSLTDDGKRLVDKITDTDDYTLIEERNDNINQLINFMVEKLNEVFTPAECDIFILYFKLKCGKHKISYKKLSKITGISVKDISNIIQKIKAWVKTNEEIIETKRKLLGK